MCACAVELQSLEVSHLFGQCRHLLPHESVAVLLMYVHLHAVAAESKSRVAVDDECAWLGEVYGVGLAEILHRVVVYAFESYHSCVDGRH